MTTCWAKSIRVIVCQTCHILSLIGSFHITESSTYNCIFLSQFVQLSSDITFCKESPLKCAGQVLRCTEWKVCVTSDCTVDLKTFTDALVNYVILFYNITSWDDVSPLSKILKTSVRILLEEREDVCVMNWIGGEWYWRGPDQASTKPWLTPEGRIYHSLRTNQIIMAILTCVFTHML